MYHIKENSRTGSTADDEISPTASFSAVNLKGERRPGACFTAPRGSPPWTQSGPLTSRLPAASCGHKGNRQDSARPTWNVE